MGCLRAKHRVSVALPALSASGTRRASVAARAAVVALAASAMGAGAACYSQGDGADPPLDQLYFPVSLQVSHGGSVLYVANADFDLQYNGGTLQSYDLALIRRHALDVIANPSNPALPWVRPPSSYAGLDGGVFDCQNPPVSAPSGSRQPLGETCAPPVRSEFYHRDTGVIGAFATEMLLSDPPVVSSGVAPRSYDRLFVPVRGNATLTWANVVRDSFDTSPPANLPADKGQSLAAYAPWVVGCEQAPDTKRCSARHQVGEDPYEQGNTRQLRMPGEPFGVALSQDGRSALVTHQNETKTSLFLTGLGPTDVASAGPASETPPSLQFILEGVAAGGVGLAAIPHDPRAFVGQTAPFPAFLQTSRARAEVELLRQYPDEANDLVRLPDGGTATKEGQVVVPSSLRRPFLTREAGFPITVSPSAVDSRGIVIDPTPRLACQAKLEQAGGGTEEQQLACARRPSRVFITNRAPAALLIGEVGGSNAATGLYDPDLLTIFRSEPLSAGPSRVYVAPIVDRDGAYALRVFVVCFDAAQVFVFDPDTGALENVIRVGPGPFALAFDPFDAKEVASHAVVPPDPRLGAVNTRYRFAYVASFTQSFVQLLDLDRRKAGTFERVVFTLGEPRNPKGT